MDLLLIRHGEPMRVAETPDGSPADPPLAERGRHQAALLAAWLTHEPVHHVTVSPLRRARETAEPLAAALGLEPEIIDGLAEFDAEATSYVPAEELRATADPRLRAMAEGRWEVFGSMVEPATFQRGAVETIEAMIARHHGQRVAVICHGAVINVYLAHLLGMERLLWFEPGYTSISRVAASRRGVRSVVSVNERCHLR